ncbi:MAG: hypothetical protein LC799_04340 [Actinobacteria bacterium]|nr:hypothetical protein [Actinomycetota bacterium]
MTTAAQPSERWRRVPLATAVIAGGFFLAAGLWAMVSPRSFFEGAAAFDPYNQHFIQDIGAFQIGLGAVLLLAAVLSGGDSLAVPLLGVGVGSGAHLVSHIVGRDLGGKPATDISLFTLLTVLLVAGGLMRLRAVRE